MIYLHVGLARAGSSTIQRFLSVNSELLRQHGFDVPDMKLVNAAARYMRRERREEHHKPALARLRDQLQSQPAANYIISSESFGYPVRDVAQQVRAILPSGDVRVIVYVRDFPAHIVSIYNQHTVMGRNTDDFDTIFERRDFSKSRWLESPWAGEFGLKAMRFRSLNDLKSGSLTADFAATVGIDTIPGLDFLSGVRVRSSKNWMSVELARLLAKVAAENGHTIPRAAFVKTIKILSRIMLGRKLMGIRHPVQYLTPEQWRELRDSYNRFIASINAKFDGHSLPPLEDSPPPPRAFLPSFETIPNEIKRRLERVGSPKFQQSHPDVPPAILEAVAKRALE